MKRVYALYRVSTAKQVDHVACGNTIKDDIPIHNMEILFISSLIMILLHRLTRAHSPLSCAMDK